MQMHGCHAWVRPHLCQPCVRASLAPHSMNVRMNAADMHLRPHSPGDIPTTDGLLHPTFTLKMALSRPHSCHRSLMAPRCLPCYGVETIQAQLPEGWQGPTSAPGAKQHPLNVGCPCNSTLACQGRPASYDNTFPSEGDRFM